MKNFHDFVHRNSRKIPQFPDPIKIFSNQSRFSTIYSNNSEKYFIQMRPGNLDVSIDSYFRSLPSTNFSSNRLKLKAENIELQNKRKVKIFMMSKRFCFLRPLINTNYNFHLKFPKIFFFHTRIEVNLLLEILTGILRLILIHL